MTEKRYHGIDPNDVRVKARRRAKEADALIDRLSKYTPRYRRDGSRILTPALYRELLVFLTRVVNDA